MAVRKRPKWPTTPAAAAAVDAGLADAAPVAENFSFFLMVEKKPGKGECMGPGGGI